MSMICTNCGASISDGKKFCAACGTKVEEMGAAPQPAMAAAPARQPTAPEAAFGPPPPKGSPYAVISTLGYVGYFLVMSLPLVGLILMIVWAFSKSGPLNRRNLARAMLVFLILAVVLSIITVILFLPMITQMINASAYLPY